MDTASLNWCTTPAPTLNREKACSPSSDVPRRSAISMRAWLKRPDTVRCVCCVTENVSLKYNPKALLAVSRPVLKISSGASP